MKIPCNEENCTEEVEYRPKRVFGFTKKHEADSERGEEEITVYLTCRNNHTYAYRVKKG